jgi:hypothetical protein
VPTGTATIDFGASPGTQRTTVTITGQSAIGSSSHVEAFFMSDTTTDHSDYEHQMAAMVCQLPCGNIVVGTGFDVVAVSQVQMRGQFTIHWVWV